MGNDWALPLGKPRVGFLDHGHPSTPALAAQLTRTENAIVVQLPWIEDDHRTIERWFGEGAHWADDPDKAKYRYNPPDTLDFEDSIGRVALVGCHSRGSARNFMNGIGLGQIVVDYALPGASWAAKYVKINALRSEIDGLGNWVHRNSLEISPQYDAASRLKTVDFHLESPAAIPLIPRLNMTIRPSFRYDPGRHPDETTITERMFVETDVKGPRGWEEHWSLHIAMLDLLRVCSWQRLHFLTHQATRDDDPLRTIDGAGHGRQWYPVETLRTGVDPRPSDVGPVEFLFYFDEVLSAGLGRWIHLRDKMARAFDPLLGLLGLRRANLETHCVQLGIGLEALGYLLAQEKGMGHSRARDQSFDNRLTRLAEDCTLPLPFDIAEWIDDTRRMYRAVKHADNELPDPAALRSAYYRGIQVFRIWVAGRLGVQAAVLAHTLPLDRVNRLLRSQ